MNSFKSYYMARKPIFLREGLSIEANIVKTELVKLGYKNIQPAGSTNWITVFVPAGTDRLQIQKDIISKLNQYKPTIVSKKSSIGEIFLNNGVYISVKNQGKQGILSAGKTNEHIFYTNIQEFINIHGSVKITFDSGLGKKFSISDCVGIRDTSTEVSERQKADFILTDQNGEEIPISLKKDNADMWESADSYYGPKARRYIDKLQHQGKIKLTKYFRSKSVKFPGKPLPVVVPDYYFEIQPKFAIKATEEETIDVVFGSDLLKKHGAVIVKSFKDSDFIPGDEELVILSSEIITDPKQIENNVWFLVRNDKTRTTGKPPLKGIRVVAVQARRLTKQTLRVE